MKLPNGFGSVYKLSGNRRNPYVAKKTKGWEIDPITGKSKQLYITVGYYPTRKEALTALAEYNKDPFDLHHATITFEEVYENWSEIHFEKIKDTNGYKAAFNTSKPLWKMRFVDIKLDHLQSVVDSSGKNTPTLKTLKILWGLMYDYAVIHEIVSAAYQRSVSCESSSSVQLNRCGVHKHRTDTVRNIRRLLFKNGNGIRHRKNPDRCIRK